MFKKTVFISVPGGFATRNILRGGTFELLKKNKELRIVILSPIYDNPEFIKEFAAENVFFEKLITFNKPTKTQQTIIDLRTVLSLDKVNTKSTEIKYKKIVTEKKPKKLLFRFFYPFLKTDAFWKILNKVEDKYFDLSYYDKLFEKYNPDLVFTTSLIIYEEKLFLKRAVKRKIPSISMIISWDNLSTKGLLDPKPSKIIVWNEIMKEDAIRLHNLKESDISITGAPQFDIYVSKELDDKKTFFRKYRINSKDKLITYATVTPRIFDKDDDVIEIISKAIKSGKIKYPSHILIRPHPKDDFKIYERFKDDPDVTLQIPAKKNMIFSDQCDFDKKDILELANTMKNTDVLVNINSTISIDAAIFDTPVINVTFDGYQKREYIDSVKRYFEYPHFKKLMSFNGTKLVNSEQELIDSINTYLDDPSLDRQGRLELVKNECYLIDGNASTRISNIILSELNLKEKGVEKNEEAN